MEKLLTKRKHRLPNRLCVQSKRRQDRDSMTSQRIWRMRLKRQSRAIKRITRKTALKRKRNENTSIFQFGRSKAKLFRKTELPLYYDARHLFFFSKLCNWQIQMFNSFKNPNNQQSKRPQIKVSMEILPKALSIKSHSSHKLLSSFNTR